MRQYVRYFWQFNQFQRALASLFLVISTILPGTRSLAQTNIALSATANHSGGGAGVYAAYNYNDNIVAPNTGCTSSAEPWGWVLTNGWITLTWPAPVTFNKIVLFKSNRPMTSCVMEYWDGSTFVPFHTYSSSTCTQDSLTFAPVTTTILRFNNVAGSSNPNHREIRVFSNVTAPPSISGSSVYCIGQTISLTASSIVPGPVYTWSGPLGFSATGASITIPGATLANAGTYSCVVTPSAGGSPSAPALVNVTVNPLPSAITGTTNVCAPGTSVLSCSPPGGTWSSSNVAIATIAGSGTTATVTGVGIGTVNISYIMGGGCFSSTTVTVNTSPTATVSATPASFCSGSSTMLSAIISGSTNVLSQNFNSGLGAWTVSNTSGSTASFWQVASSPAWAGVTGDGSAMMQAAADAFSSLTNTTLISPVFSMVGYTAGTLAFNQFYSASAGDAAVNIQYSINGGSTWSPLTSLAGTSVGGYTWSAASPTSTYALPGAMMGQSNCRLRWNYISTAGLWWMLDNINITGLAPTPAAVSWSPLASLYTDAGLSVPYTGGISASPVYAAPTATFSPVVHTYTATVTSGSCVNSLGAGSVTVNPIPEVISGSGVVCAGSSIVLSSATLGGSWISSSSNATVAGAGTTCTVTGVSAGTAIISYVVGSGCLRTTTITINPLPEVITGPGTVCVGSSVTLANATPLGVWTSGNTSIATVGSVSGVITGIAAGSTQISYTTPDGCVRSHAIVVNALPTAISGPAELCTGSSAAFTSSPSGGAWLASNSNVTLSFAGASATVNGVSAGTTAISYVLGTGCFTTRVITINETPAAITGPTSVCVGSSITLSNATSGGSWLSGNVAIALANASGEVTGVSAGSLLVSYITGSGCFRTRSVTVNPLPAALAGSASVCTGTATIISSSPSGGVWSADNANVSVSFSGATCTVNGLVAGTSTLSYMLGTGCFRTGVVTINETPAAISGPATVCEGSVAAYGSITSGGTWVSSNLSVGTINSEGVFSALNAGITTVSYSTSAGCVSLKTVTVHERPAIVTGSLSVCTGSSTLLSSASGGGSWSASNTSVSLLSAGTTCTVSGITAGTSVITYALATGCGRTVVVTINESPAVIAGPSSVCVGNTITLTNTSSGGTWVSSNVAVATVDGAGIVAGVSAGSVNISYVSGVGCFAAAIISVNASPAAITGSLAVCTGGSTVLSSSGAGGIWSASNTLVALTPSGIACTVSGVSAGTAIVSYTSALGCSRTVVVTVNETPAPIAGTFSVCVGATTMLSNTFAGGIWSTAGTTVATVSAVGLVSGVSAGTALVSYTSVAGCFATATVTVNGLPAAVSGMLSVCSGSSVVLTNSTPAGIWASSGSAVSLVPVGTSCTVNGLVAGTAAVSYILPTGCYTTAHITVNTTPASIIGATSICAGATTVLTNTTVGGSWVSGNIAIATINAAGLLTAITAGSVVVSYIMPSGCFSTFSLMVNPVPAGISLSPSVCEGAAATATIITSGGTWSASATNVTLSPAGTNCVVTGVSAGSVTISYTLASGCYSTAPFSVLVQPAPITGAPMLSPAGGTTLLGSAPAGGLWTSSNADVAAVGSSTGLVTGGEAGTANITYTASSGCFVTTQVTVAPLSINGPDTVCSGANAVYTHAVPGGTWSTSAASVASIDAVSGILSGISGGVVTITYTPFAGFFQTRTVIVQGTLPVPGGATSVCLGAVASVIATPAGGVWLSSNVDIATIHPTSGIVTGTGAGTVWLTYTLGSCFASRMFTVHPLPASVTGPDAVCVGASVSLSSSSPGGSWSVSGTAASISSGGVVVGNAAGTGVVSYTNSFGCRSVLVVTVHALPSAISGTLSMCQGSTTILSSGPAPISWSHTNPSIATVATTTSTTGTVTGVSVGTTTISCISSAGCIRTVTVTVTSPLPAISGALSVCPGGTIAMTIPASGGAWASSMPARATIGGGTGIVTGVSAGTVYITYATTPTCYTTKEVTVNAIPEPIGGTTTVCAGSHTVLTHPAEGGTWSSTNMLAATVGSANGIVSGLNAGTTNITYRISEGCFRTVAVSVSATPPAITGPSFVCEGSSIILANSVSGTWSSSEMDIATISSSGSVNGISSGTTTISFRATATGCFATRVLSVNIAPSSIEGGDNVCVSSTAMYMASPDGGSWSSSAVAVLGVGSVPGAFVGFSAGTSSITYLLNGCRSVKTVTVVSMPAVISGVSALCSGASTILSSFSAGLVWSSAQPDVATVVTATATTGLVTGVSGGTATISYTNAFGCARTYTVSVSPSPSDIAGIDQICVGGIAAFTNSVSGGTWTSSTPTVASITLTGLASGISAGTTVITYRTSATCFATRVVTVTAAPSLPIAGTLSVCAGSTTSLSYPVTGGTWGSSNPAVALVSESGTVTGISAGTATITYTTSESCFRTAVVTVHPLPFLPVGADAICEASVTTFTNGMPGGTWQSSNDAVAGITPTTGIVSGISEGVATISYQITATGCFTTKAITVNPLPDAITGINPLCTGTSDVWGNTTSGGVWANSGGAATVNATTGAVSAMFAGTSIISYTLPTGCRRTVVATVNAQPANITGTLIVCIGSTTTLNSLTAGQTWSSANESIASVEPGTSTTGVVTGLVAGTTTISYTNSFGCSRTVIVTVTASPTDIEGDDVVCIGGSTTLTNPLPGGTWSSGTTNASVGVSTGVVTGLVVGMARITYRIGAACYTVKHMSVSVQPSEAIVGPSSVCVGASMTLSHPLAGGVWSSGNVMRAIVGSATGIVTGVSSGTLPVSYFVTAGCYKTTSISVSAAVMPINGPLSVCVGATVTLNSATSGTRWTSTDVSVATINFTTGVVTGIAPGTATIIQTNPTTGCFVTRDITVNPLPSSIDGSNRVCVGATTTLTGTPAGGTWVTSAGIYATVGVSSGVVTGVAAATVRVTYTLPTGCRMWQVMTVDPIPGIINGIASVTVPGSTTLSCATTGGTWASSNVSRATIGTTTGVMTGVSAGTVTITYQLSSTGCFRTRVATVNPASPRPQMDDEIAAGVRIYPSPTSGLLTVDYLHDGVLELFAADGRVVQHYTIRQPQTTVQLPAYLAAGVYMCRFTGEDGQIAIVRIVYAP